MFWIAMFLTMGGVYVAVDRGLSDGLLVVIGATIVLYLLSLPLWWLIDKTGLYNFIDLSWRQISGVDGNADMNAFCSEGSGGTWWQFALYFVFWIISIGGAFLGIWVLPVALICTVIGGFITIFGGDEEFFQKSLLWVVGGLGGILVAGLMFRGFHLMAQANGCA